MATIPITLAELRRAIGDPRYRTDGHPEREDFAAWVTRSWRAFDDAPSAAAPGTEKVVHVRAYERRSGGRTQQVGAYTQRRQGGQAGGQAGDEAPAPGLLNVSDWPEALPVSAPPQAPTPIQPGRPAERAPEPVLIFVGGLFDRWLFQPVGSVFEALGKGDLLMPNDRWFDWDDRAGIEAHIASLPPGTPVRLIGHSWGADTAAQIAADAGEAGRPIDTLVTIDPVGFGTSEGFFRRVQQGAGRWINVNAAGGGSLEPSNAVAGIGSPWNALPERFSQFWNAPFPHAEFGEMMLFRPGDGRNPSAWDLVRRR